MLQGPDVASLATQMSAEGWGAGSPDCDFPVRMLAGLRVSREGTLRFSLGREPPAFSHSATAITIRANEGQMPGRHLFSVVQPRSAYTSGLNPLITTCKAVSRQADSSPCGSRMKRLQVQRNVPKVTQTNGGPDPGLLTALWKAALLFEGRPWGEDVGGEVCACTLFLFRVQAQTPSMCCPPSGTELGRGGVGLFDGGVLRPGMADRCHRNEGVGSPCWRRL